MAEPITRALMAAMMQGAVPMVLTDPNLPDHPMIAVNPAFEAVTGYSAAESVGRNCRFLQGAGTDRLAVERLRQCIAARHGCVEWLVNHRRDGSVFWNLLFITPVFSATGDLLHFFGNQRDITEGPGADLPNFSLGRADLPAESVARFNALLGDVVAGEDARAAGAGLAALVEAARRLDFLTLQLAGTGWAP